MNDEFFHTNKIIKLWHNLPSYLLDIVLKISRNYWNGITDIQLFIIRKWIKYSFTRHILLYGVRFDNSRFDTHARFTYITCAEAVNSNPFPIKTNNI